MDDLAPLREQIDAVDAELIHLLAERFALVKQVKLIKDTTGKAALDELRWQEVSSRIGELAEQEQLNPAATKLIFDAIHNYALHQIYGK